MLLVYTEPAGGPEDQEKGQDGGGTDAVTAPPSLSA